MTADAKDDISEDTMRDDALCGGTHCEACTIARLCDRQRLLIAALTEQVAALKEEIASHVRGEA